MGITGVAVKLKRLRQRFGISAPKLAIRTHVAWYWRALSAIAILSVSLALGAWIYDAARGISGQAGSVWEIEGRRMAAELADVRTELTTLRTQVGTAESTLQIERAAQHRLSQQVKSLEVENARLKQDLAFFEGLIPSPGGSAGVRISGLQIVEESPGHYRYRMLLVNSGERQARDFSGSLQLLVRVQGNGKDDTISFPSPGESDPGKFAVEFRNFRRVEGNFTVSDATPVKSVEATLLQDGQVRARQSVNL